MLQSVVMMIITCLGPKLCSTILSVGARTFIHFYKCKTKNKKYTKEQKTTHTLLNCFLQFNLDMTTFLQAHLKFKMFFHQAKWLHLYNTSVQSTLQCFYPFTHTPTYGSKRSSLTIRSNLGTQGHFNMQRGGGGDRTTNPVVRGRPS